MANMDGSDVVTVLNVNAPKAIALHPCQGYSWFSHVFFYICVIAVLPYFRSGVALYCEELTAENAFQSHEV